MVLNWVLGAALAATAACSQSLFDNHGARDDTTGGTDAMIPSSCAEPCIADAAVDFNSTPGGARGNWRYLDDHRDRTWLAMAAMPTLMTGVDPRNHIASCKDNPTFTACQSLPGALLITSAGAASIADPAIEFTVASPTVIQITLRVLIPGTSPQLIRLYRNSREDALYTGVAEPSLLVEQGFTVDALAGDRFLLAVAPTGQGTTNVGVQLFATATGAAFPTSCELAVTFDGASGMAVADRCRKAQLESLMDPAAPVPVMTMAGPYMEAGEAGNFVTGGYLRDNTKVEQGNDLTVQFWFRQRAPDALTPTWLFSDLDLDFGGGLGIALGTPDTGSQILDVTSATDNTGMHYVDATTTIPTDGAWQFLRVVHAGDQLSVCVNGEHRVTKTFAVGQLNTTYAPYIGKNALWSPSNPVFDGEIDDLRMFRAALPCN